MAEKSIQKSAGETGESHVPGIRDLLSGVDSEVRLRMTRYNPQPLSADEIAAIEKVGQAAANTFLAAQMGLEIVADHIHAMAEHGESGRENEAAALLNLLSELIYYTHETETEAEYTLRTHYQNLVERTPVASPIASKAERGTRGAK